MDWTFFFFLFFLQLQSSDLARDDDLSEKVKSLEGTFIVQFMSVVAKYDL